MTEEKHELACGHSEAMQTHIKYINQSLTEIKKLVTEQTNNYHKLDKKVAKMEIKSGLIALIVSFVGGVVGYFVRN